MEVSIMIGLNHETERICPGEYVAGYDRVLNVKSSVTDSKDELTP